MKCSHEHNRVLMGLVYAFTYVGLFLHMIGHLIPIIVTNVALHDAIEPYLHHPVITIAAWSFLPLMIYHWWKDRQIHDELHRLQHENEEFRRFFLIHHDGDKRN